MSSKEIKSPINSQKKRASIVLNEHWILPNHNKNLVLHVCRMVAMFTKDLSLYMYIFDNHLIFIYRQIPIIIVR